MELSDYNFELPPELIAQEPLSVRESSRMLAVDRGAGSFRDEMFRNLPSILERDDLLVLNNTRVFPARLIGHTPTGARIEVFLIEEAAGPDVWIALARPGRRLRLGSLIDMSPDLSAEVVEKLEDGKIVVAFRSKGDLENLIESVGQTPLPPYIRREGAGPDNDRDRYQTVFAAKKGAIAAPTAGLHFSPEVLGKIRERGIEVAEITLHVGYGTFEPVRAADISAHRVAAERFVIEDEAAEKLEDARVSGRRIVAVGTTTTRTLEHMLHRHGRFLPQSGMAELTILPGYRFAAVGALLTNFHLPESSLLILVATFGGHRLIMDAYRHAVSSRYRFYSYGDCMLIE